MRTLFAGLLMTGLVALTGCTQSTTGGGGSAGGTFKLRGPATSTDVKHGEKKNIEITVSEDKNFKEDITLTASISPADKGVTAELDPQTIKASDQKKTNLIVHATDKAAQGKYTVTVTGKPAKGNPTSVNVEIKVPEKK